MLKRLLDTLDHRTGFRAIVHEALYERVPGGPRWRYVWGSTLVFAFVVQMITGFFLWTAYSPNAQGAWESVYYIQHEMQGGWLLRGIHHFMAQAMIVLLVLHLMQVVIDGAYKAPREINFWVGLVLMLIVLGLSLTGYLLPWDQKGFWATKVATNIMDITPVVGPELKRTVVGGSEYGHHTLTRFFAIHAGLLPFLLMALLALHLYVFRRHGITPYKVDPQRDATFWPDQILRDAVACLAVMCAVLALVFLPWLRGEAEIGPELGAELGAPADPTDRYSAARPEWYFLFLFQFLKLFPGETEVIGAIVVPGVVIAVLFLMPLVGRSRIGHQFNVGFLGLVLAGAIALTVVAIREDADNPDHGPAVADALRASERVPELVEAYGIRSEGAVHLVRNDPFLQGPKIFAKQCASCHRYHGHDGTGRKVLEKVGEETVEAKPTAADLGNFGSREWIKSVVSDFPGHFAALKNADWYPQTEEEADEAGEFIDLGETSADINMAGF
ncbi:MAG: cytochrome b N-terminal domain-containing protein, partial [Planctomycetes bacterium]|nr:cytochrome b N-terminal domain-containing protein [Planctomycetota bacterium]